MCYPARRESGVGPQVGESGQSDRRVSDAKSWGAINRGEEGVGTKYLTV